MGKQEQLYQQKESFVCWKKDAGWIAQNQQDIRMPWKDSKQLHELYCDKIMIQL